MWGLAAAITLLTISLSLAQPVARTMSGVVVDQDGNPAAGVSIDHAGGDSRTVETDAQGRFSIQARGPFVVLRKARYQSLRVAVEERQDARLTIKITVGVEQVPVCTPPGKYAKLDGFGSFFRFPLRHGVKASAQRRDIDCSMRTYSLNKRMGGASILHGSGFSWSSGHPSSHEVWESVSYEERRREGPGFVLLDARGRTANGLFWRYLGNWYESASYAGANEEAAKLLDQVLDGLCRQ